MIILEHTSGLVAVRAYDAKKQEISLQTINACEALLFLAKKFPNEHIIWVEAKLSSQINGEVLKSQFSHQREVLTFSNTNYFPACIGYVENSSFLKVNPNVKYPTWQMSSQLGGALGSQLLQFKNTVSEEMGLDYMLCSIAKLGQPKGLCCYRLPLETLNTVDVKQATTSIVFKFVRQHYRLQWQFLLLFNLIVFENKWPILYMLKSVCTQKRLHLKNSLPTIQVKKEVFAQQQQQQQQQLDVIIPTIGRASYLYDVLKDLSNQTILPETVIIVEQNPKENASTELDYIKTKSWQFKIIHQFIHETGACNARNIALQLVKSSWVFMADDDIRIASNFIEKALIDLNVHSNTAMTFSCLKEGETEQIKNLIQWNAFGSGCSIVESDIAKKVGFDTSFENGFGEDAAFGNDLRNRGVDVLYNPFTSLTHLKAPIGGFRQPVKFLWNDDKIKPKPSPTVMLFQLKHRTPEQVKGYKSLLFLKFYKKQNIKNPIRYVRVMKQRWNASVKWANYLDK
ncbi:glycosyltransferase family 2 protein [Croceibacter atlanticus]|uniref:Glycosyltransferase 2-like domain-containing protein n=1 Tax=Croceibacter atlanticus (strain ATCC BAA-628 / JCM 21780 / CIP 108009 / IAM 15332 / KCTC 12090 / HTCC2559) TaxID=216432 RepID=A3U8I6_CROAH|nr:glycosyltransferase family A protein [Croceibacter atlanticus]EAP88553.1 hypothetical protein CA2559_07320 [Croceibacter atlanticus HTCC2559]